MGTGTVHFALHRKMKDGWVGGLGPTIEILKKGLLDVK